MGNPFIEFINGFSNIKLGKYKGETMDMKRPGKHAIITAGIAAASIILAGPSFAEKKEKNKNKGNDPFSSQIEQQMKNEEDALKKDANKEKDKYANEGAKKADAAYQIFSSSEKDAIKGFYSVQSQNLPPGLQKKVAKGGSLPPGWQKKVTKGQVIPSDIYRQAEPLPKDIMIQLPPLTAGTSIMKIDNRIVKVADATKTIIDVIDLP